MIKEYTVVDGDKAEFIYAGHEFTFECDEKDIDKAYDALAENLDVKDEADLIDFQNAEDDDVATLLDNMKHMGFIDSWEVKEVEE